VATLIAITKAGEENSIPDGFSPCALENGIGATSMCPGQQMRDASAAPRFPELEGRHPCFSTTAAGHARSGRLHLPVSPGCNIACRFCKRDTHNQDAHRPGVSRRVLTPEAAVEAVGRALELCPAINVAGIAGPGDSLCTDHAIRTFELVHAAYPNLINCVSTNGLLLPRKAERLIAAGVGTITVTVNAVDPELLPRICSSVFYDGRRLAGEEAARRSIGNQVEGIKIAAKLGAVVKINTVLIPGINDHHVGQVARVTAEAGASLINVIPLIPQHEFAELAAPTAGQLDLARRDAARFLTVFSHCQRCRADACGIPGVSEFSGQVYEEKLFASATFSHG
jgi:nitrogen fixation protein NifB